MIYHLHRHFLLLAEWRLLVAFQTVGCRLSAVS